MTTCTNAAADGRASVMDALAFFDRVLPLAGVRCVVAMKPKRERGVGDRPVEHFVVNNAEAAAVAVELDRRGLDVYFTPATFQDGSSRKACNAAWIKSAFLDIDCGPGKPYPDKGEGILAVKKFCKAIGLSMPMLVDSGNGLHCYFVFDRDMAPSDWSRIAKRLKLACKIYGLKADRAVTADIARLLRVPGTHNRKAAS